MEVLQANMLILEGLQKIGFEVNVITQDVSDITNLKCDEEYIGLQTELSFKDSFTREQELILEDYIKENIPDYAQTLGELRDVINTVNYNPGEYLITTEDLSNQ